MPDSRSGQGLIQTLRDWCAQHQRDSGRGGVRAVLSDSSAGGSAFVELESDERIGRATVWSTGFCDVEVLAISSGDQVFYEHHESVDAPRLRALLDGLVAQVQSKIRTERRR